MPNACIIYNSQQFYKLYIPTYAQRIVCKISTHLMLQSIYQHTSNKLAIIRARSFATQHTWNDKTLKTSTGHSDFTNYLKLRSFQHIKNI